MGVSKSLIQLPPLINIPLSGELWVAKNGNDTTGNGSKLNPFLTIQKAYDVSTSDTLIAISAGDFTEDLVFDGNKSNNILIRGIGIEDQHRTKLIGFHAFINQATRISFEDIQMADNGILGDIFDLTDSDGRHYFKNITFNLTNGNSKPMVTGNGTANWHIFQDCTMSGEIDSSVGTLTGTPLFYFQECTGAYGIIQAQGVSVTALGCVVGPYIIRPGAGINGALTLANCDFMSVDSGGDSIDCSGSSDPANNIYLSNVNFSNTTGTAYGAIMIDNAPLVLGAPSSRGITSDIISGAITRRSSTKDMNQGVADDTPFTFGDSDDANMQYNSATNELDFNPPTGSFANINGYTKIAGATLPYVLSRNALQFSYLMNDIVGGQPVHAAIGMLPILEYTQQATSIFGSLQALNASATVQPGAALPSNGAVDTMSIRGAAINSTYNTLGKNRNPTSVSGLANQTAMRGNNGTCNLAVAVSAQAGTVLGNSTITQCTSMQALPPFKFLAGGSTITSGITFRAVGGILGSTSNWNGSFEGASTPNRFQGNVVVGQLTETASAFRLYMNGHAKFANDFGVFMGGTLNADAEFGLLRDTTSGRIRFGSAGNALTLKTNRLLFDFETTDNIVDVTGTNNSAVNPGIIWDLASTRINNLFGFDKAPVGVQNVTGSRGGNAALTSLLTGLANFGFITDNTTA